MCCVCKVKFFPLKTGHAHSSIVLDVVEKKQTAVLAVTHDKATYIIPLNFISLLVCHFVQKQWSYFHPNKMTK